MSRNFKTEYLKKLAGIETQNGYKIDIANYLYNPSHSSEYPTLRKKIEETPEKVTYSTIYFMKYYDGSAEYLHKVYTMPNNKDNWNITTEVSETVLEPGTRFSLNKLVQIAENI